MHPLLPFQPSHSLSILILLTLLLPFSTALPSTDNDSPAHTATIHYQPLQSPHPLPLAVLTYKPSLPRTYAVQSFTPPSVSSSSSSSSSLIRIGILNTSSNTLSGATTLTALSSFEPSLYGTFYVWLNPVNGNVWSVSYRASSTQPSSLESSSADNVTGEDSKTHSPNLRILERVEAPRPVLNRPVVLSPEGKVEGEVVEKTFLQKYWWLLLGAAVLAMAGGGGEK